MFEGKGLANCPVAVVKAYLSHLNPKCEALFQNPLTGAKFKLSSDVIWYSTLPLGHNTINSMMKNMCLRAGIDPPEVNRSPLETVSKAIHSSTSTNVQENIFVQENMSTNAAHGIISGGSFSNCSFNFHFK